MGRLRLHPCWRTALVGTLLAGAFACEEDRGGRSRAQPGTSSPSTAQRQDPSPSAARGLRLSLPDGWTARPEERERLAFGPGGRTVAWLERSSGELLPTPEELKSGFNAALVSPAPRQLASKADGSAVWWMGRVHPPDGAAWTVGLCAKKVEGGLYLVGTVPGATEAEVRAALSVCRSLAWEG